MITETVVINFKVGQSYIIRYNKRAHLISLRCARPTGRMCCVCVCGCRNHTKNHFAVNVSNFRDYYRVKHIKAMMLPQDCSDSRTLWHPTNALSPLPYPTISPTVKCFKLCQIGFELIH